MATYTGDAGNNQHRGTPGPDFIRGLGGDDTLDGAAGDDTVLGGGGADNLDGGKGRDSLAGGAGDDFVGSFYQEGPDTIDGGDGDDLVAINRFSDQPTANDLTFVVTNTATPTRLQGDGTRVVNVESFSLVGGFGDDTFVTLDGDDALFGSAGNDLLDAGRGNDDLEDDFSIGSDTLNGGAGEDLIESRGDRDVIDGGSGDDTAEIDLGQSTADLFFVMTDAGSTTRVQGDGTTVVDVEEISFSGGSGDDTVTALGGDDSLLGASGSDVLSGGGGADLILGKGRDDRLYGQEGDDLLDGGSGSDTLNGGRGDDFLRAGLVTTGGDDAPDTLRFNGDFGNDRVRQFQDGSDRVLLVGYAEDDLTISQSGSRVRLTLDNGTDAGVVTINDFSGTFDASDYGFA